MTEEDLDREIVLAVNKEWGDHRSPLLISQLGLARLSEPAKRFIKEQKLSLKRHVRTRLYEQLRFVPMLRQGGGVAPRAGTAHLTDEDLENAFAEYQRAKGSARQQTRFHPAIWAAFRDPMPPATRRIVSISSDELSVRQEPEGAAPGPNEHAIDPHETALTATSGEFPTAEDVRLAIVEWCREHQVELAKISIAPAPQPAGSPRPTHRDVAPPTGLQSLGLLEVLRMLPKEQLARLSVPGDVVLSILDHMSRR
jgi:hypothetical protein